MIDSIIEKADGNFLAVVGPWCFDYDFEGGIALGPARLAADDFPGFPPFPDAMLMGQGDRAQKLYVFSASQYYRYDLSSAQPTLDPTYPRPIRNNWPGLDQLRIGGYFRAATTLPDGQILFFRNDDVIRYDFQTGVIGTPEPIADAFPGLPDEIDCAVMGKSGSSRAHMLYAIKGDEYWRFNTATGRIDGANGASFTANWQNLTPPVDHALLVQGRRKMRIGLPARWERFDKAALVTTAYQRLDDPDLIRQRGTPLCGQAAILYALARWHPARYIDAAISAIGFGGLIGSATIPTPEHEFTPRDRVFAEGVPPGSNIAPIDWVTMGILRDDENALRGIGADRGDIANGITTPNEMRFYLKHLFPDGEIEVDRALVGRKRNAIEKARDAVAQGGHAFLLTSSDGTLPMAPGLPNHWVAYISGLTFHGGLRYTGVDLRCWSWGGLHDMTLTRQQFRNGFYGVVTWVPG